MPLGNSLSTDEHRERAQAEMERLVVRLQDELDRLIKLYVFARESLENEMLSGVGYKKMGLNEKDVKKLKELTVGMNSLIESKIKWDKAQKQLAATMTPKEEMDAVFKYICTLSGEDQHLLRDRLNDRGIWKWRT
jgi:hypothetical protein